MRDLLTRLRDLSHRGVVAMSEAKGEPSAAHAIAEAADVVQRFEALCLGIIAYVEPLDKDLETDAMLHREALDGLEAIGKPRPKKSAVKK